MTTPRKRGRPRLDKPPKVLRRPKAITPGKSANRVTIRLSDEMAANLERYAATHGLPSVSAAVREIILNSPMPSAMSPQQSPNNHAHDKH